MREDAATFDWQSLFHTDLDIYASNINDAIHSLAEKYIPNKTVRIRPLEPRWINNTIKSKIRYRKRLYRKARLTNAEYHWRKFKSCRNEIVTLIRETKRQYYVSIAGKLVSNSSSTDWWI